MDAGTGFLRQPFDRAFIGEAIAVGIAISHRRFAQHVEAVGEPARAFGGGALERLGYGPPEDELAAKDAHGLQRRLADHRFAQPVHGGFEGPGHAALLLLWPFEHFARQHQREGRGVDEGGAGFAEVVRPLDIADLVADQRIGCAIVRHAQQRFGQAHQRDAFFGRQPVLVQEGINAACLLPPRAFDQRDRERLGLLVQFGSRSGLSQPFRDALLLVLPIGEADGMAV